MKIAYGRGICQRSEPGTATGEVSGAGHQGTFYFCGKAKRQGFRAATLSSHPADDPRRGFGVSGCAGS